MVSYIFNGKDVNVKRFNDVHELTDIFDFDLDRGFLVLL